MSSIHQPIRWGILGCGAVTEAKSGPAYQMIDGMKLCAVMRRNKEKAQDYAARHRIPKFYNDADLLITDQDIDAVYIATPPDSHTFYGLKVAAAGKICCVEKPLAPSYQECMDICNAFKRANLPLFVAYYRRTLPRFNQVKIWLEAGRIGTVRHANWQYRRPASTLDLSGDYNWRTDSKIAPGGYFDDLASHGLDLIIHYLGKINEVHGFSLNQQGLYPAKDAISACWVHDNGATGSGSWNFGCKDENDLLEISGSKGRIELSVFADKPVRLMVDGEIEEKVIKNPATIQQYHVEQMRDHILGKCIHPSTGDSATHTSWVMDRILGHL